MTSVTSAPSLTSGTKWNRLASVKDALTPRLTGMALLASMNANLISLRHPALI
jgi:hypothetical protein